jgi:nucleoside-diphosphate-sugar epimerase
LTVFIAGSTGVLGRRLIAQFRGIGWTVVAQVRSNERAALARALGAEPRIADLFDADALARAAEGADVVIHAATSIPTGRTKPSEWAMNDRIRRDGSKALTEAAGRIGAKQYIFQSIVWVARPHDASYFDETSAVVYNPIFASAADGERITNEAATKHGFGAAILRGGFFYSADAAHIRDAAQQLKARKLPIIGKGNAIWAMVHAEDAARAYVCAAQTNARGTWHVVDDEPLPVGDLLETLAAIVRAPKPRHVPAWLARWIAGDAVVDYFTTSTRTSNAHLRRDLGWQPQFPGFSAGVQQIAAEWAAEGFPHTKVK